MKDDSDKEKIRDQFRETVEKFEQYFNDPEQFHKIFTELALLMLKTDVTASALNVSR